MDGNANPAVEKTVLDGLLEDVFGLNYESSPNFKFAEEIVDPRILRHLDKMVEFYLSKLHSAYPSLILDTQKTPAKLNNAANEAQHRGELRNARDLYIFAGYAYEMQNDWTGLSFVSTHIKGLLRKLPQDFQPQKLPHWYQV